MVFTALKQEKAGILLYKNSRSLKKGQKTGEKMKKTKKVTENMGKCPKGRHRNHRKSIGACQLSLD